MKETFNQYINNLRVRKGLTLTQLGALLGIDSGTLSKIENGKKKLNEKFLPKIAEIFNLELQELKDEYFSEKIANEIYIYNCSNRVLRLAEKKVKYIKNRNTKQGSFNFESKI